jgi:hypothetical protein
MDELVIACLKNIFIEIVLNLKMEDNNAYFYLA